MQGGVAREFPGEIPPESATCASCEIEHGRIKLRCHGAARRAGWVNLVVTPPELFARSAVADLSEPDLLAGKRGAGPFHELLVKHADGGLAWVKRHKHKVELGTQRWRKVGRDPGEHRELRRLGIDLVQEVEHHQTAGSKRFDLGHRIRQLRSHACAVPCPVSLVARLPCVDLRKRGGEIPETLPVLLAG